MSNSEDDALRDQQGLVMQGIQRVGEPHDYREHKVSLSDTQQLRGDVRVLQEAVRRLTDRLTVLEVDNTDIRTLVQEELEKVIVKEVQEVKES